MIEHPAHMTVAVGSHTETIHTADGAKQDTSPAVLLALHLGAQILHLRIKSGDFSRALAVHNHAIPVTVRAEDVRGARPKVG